MNRRVIIFIIIFAIITAVFVPLLSLYGLRVCPVLSIPGFGFGCYYSGIFIFFVNVLNVGLILALHKKTPETNGLLNWFKRNRLVGFVCIYIAATIIALALLQILLHVNHLTSSSRAPEILGFASLLIGIFQAYGLNWALIDTPAISEIPGGFRKLWGLHVLRTMLPLALTVAIILHFLFSQSISFNDGSTAPIVDHDVMIEQTSYVVSFLFFWLLLTFTFHFLAERDQVKKIQIHLNHLNDMDFKFKSNLNQAWGLWTAFIGQLNSFSKVLGERTRVLKTFSQFVTASVAVQALDQELKENTGDMRELTVLMSDIRNFTSMSESLTPKQVVLLLNEYFSAMLDIVAGSQVNIDKFIGDGILAYVDPEDGEVPNAVTENRLGVHTALAMIERLKKLNIKLHTLGLPEIKIGIGISRGPLIIGFIGTEARLQHTIIGDTVNRTARLESLCKELGVPIVISGLVWHSLEPETKMLFTSFGKKTVKGITLPMEVFGGPIVVKN